MDRPPSFLARLVSPYEAAVGDGISLPAGQHSLLVEAWSVQESTITRMCGRKMPDDVLLRVNSRTAKKIVKLGQRASPMSAAKCKRSLVLLQGLSARAIRQCSPQTTSVQDAAVCDLRRSLFCLLPFMSLLIAGTTRCLVLARQ